MKNKIFFYLFFICLARDLFIYLSCPFVVSDMVFARAVWIEDDKHFDGVIPKNWIQENIVRWPKTHVQSAHKKKIRPNGGLAHFPAGEDKNDIRYDGSLTTLVLCLWFVIYTSSNPWLLTVIPPLME